MQIICRGSGDHDGEMTSRRPNPSPRPPYPEAMVCVSREFCNLQCSLLAGADYLLSIYL